MKIICSLLVVGLLYIDFSESLLVVYRSTVDFREETVWLSIINLLYFLCSGRCYVYLC